MKPLNRTKNRISSVGTQCLRPVWLLLIVFVVLVNLAIVCHRNHSSIGGRLLVECATAGSRHIVERPATTAESTSNSDNAAKQRNSTRRPQIRAKYASAHQSADKQQQRRQSSILQKGSGGNWWQATRSYRRPQNELVASDDYVGQLEDKTNRRRSLSQPDIGKNRLHVSVTPRISLVRVPVESNTILKCLISSQTNNFTEPFNITWSRFLYDTNEHQHIETELYEGSIRKPVKRGDEEEEVRKYIPIVLNAIDRLGGGTKRQEEYKDFLTRSRREIKVISDLLIEASLSISPVKSSDNGSYYCTVNNDYSNRKEGEINLIPLSKPVVRLDRVQPARDSKTALVYWTILSNGNMPIKKTILMVRNDSHRLAHPGRAMVLDSDYNQWQRIDIGGDGGEYLDKILPDAWRAPRLAPEDSVVRADVDVTSFDLGPSSPPTPDEGSSESEKTAGEPKDMSNNFLTSSDNKAGPISRRGQRAYNLSSLLPGVTYQLRLMAINDMGQSNWSELVATMPNEIPAQISDIIVLSTKNDSITIGWRRPPHDSAKTIRYEMQLFDMNHTVTLNTSTRTNENFFAQRKQKRTNFMYHFVNLHPGTDYLFHVRACSRAGCGAYSSPKRLVSTQDGEPDEPLDVELTCSLLSGGHPIVTWLPPVNTRGRLINYSVTIEAQSRYRNQSGDWTSDEWRTTIETGDNHTLSLEASDYNLMPNTNYTVRVCANNRSKKCGKLSQLSQKSTCSIGAELPRELPANIRLSLKQINTTDVDQDKPQAETLVLELPFISWRNGSIDCIQIVLIKLPKSFDAAQKALSDFLPDDPAEIEVHDYLELSGTTDMDTDDGETRKTNSIEPSIGVDPSQDERVGDNSRANWRAFAYLAEELDQINQSGSSEEISAGLKQISLGDGSQSNCDRIWATVRDRNQHQESLVDRTRAATARPKHSILAIDGALAAKTHYTGFLKLIQLRISNDDDTKEGGAPTASQLVDVYPIQRKRSTQSVELLAKYSNYFSPVRTGEYVPDVSIDALRLGMRLLNGDSESNQIDQPDGGSGSLCESDLIKTVQSKLGLSSRPCEQVENFAKTVRRILVSWFRKVVSYFDANWESDSQSKILLLVIGLLSFVTATVLLLIVYLILLPMTLIRKRKLRLKRQLQQHEDAIVAAASANTVLPPVSSPSEMQSNTNCPTIDEDSGRFVAQQQIADSQMAIDESQQQQQPDLHALDSSLGHQHVSMAGDQVDQRDQPDYGTLALPRECPIHSSPRSQVLRNNEHETTEQHEHQFDTHRARRQSVHICQTISSTNQQLDSSDYSGLRQSYAHEHHGHDSEHAEHQHQHQQQQEQHQHHESVHLRLGDSELAGSIHACSGQPQIVDDFDGRNYRTMRHLSDLHHHHHHHHHQPQQRYHTHGTVGGATDPAQGGHYQQYQQIQHSLTQVGCQRYVIGSPSHGMNSARQQHPRAYTMTMQHDPVLALAKRIDKSIPLSLFQLIFECRLRNGWLREEYEQLPRQVHSNNHFQCKINDDGRHIKLRPQLIVSRDDSVSALISGNDKYDGSLIRLQLPSVPGQLDNRSDGNSAIEKQFICAKSPVDADSVWDFWRLVYEHEVSTLVMLTPNEVTHTGQTRCAQYWPTCDDEETTILSPCNEFVQRSSILPAKFKIRQETLSDFECDASMGLARSDEFTIRRLTLLVIATRPGENDHIDTSPPTTNNDNTGRAQATESNTTQDLQRQVQPVNGSSIAADDNRLADNGGGGGGGDEVEDDTDDGDESLVIIERTLLHFQFVHWNANSASNQMRLIKFIELVNERHSRQMQQQASPGTNWQIVTPQSPILVHCANGIGRSGLFTAMSFIIDDLSIKLAATMATTRADQQHQQMSASLNIYQLVARLRNQRHMLLSPYRFYELLYQLTIRCIPSHSHNRAHNYNHNLSHGQNNIQPQE